MHSRHQLPLAATVAKRSLFQSLSDAPVNMAFWLPLMSPQRDVHRTVQAVSAACLIMW